MNVAVISLSPLGGCCGSERYTLDAIQSIRSKRDTCEAFAVREGEPGEFVHTFDGHTERELPFHEVLGLLDGFDLVWVHQYLASDLIFPILAASRPDTPLILTNLGDETVLQDFRSAYRGARHHRFVHPTERLGEAGQTFGANGRVVPAGIWADAFGSTHPELREPNQLCMLDGLTPEGGIETVLRALPDSCSLAVTGSSQLDEHRRDLLRASMQSRRITLLGAVPETRRRAVLAGSQVLIAAQEAKCDGSCADPFASVILLEALAWDTQPVSSDAGSHPEVMNALGYGDMIFPAGDHVALGSLIERVLATPEDELLRRRVRARTCIRQNYLWDDYWVRMLRALELEPQGRAGVASRLASQFAKSASAAGPAGLSAFGWKASPV